MTTSPLLTRLAGWALDLRGDTFGDERERLRRYEGIVLAANLQLAGVPIAAAALVWAAGRPAVPVLAPVMALFYAPLLVSAVYLRQRDAERPAGPWTRKRAMAALLGTVPLLA